MLNEVTSTQSDPENVAVRVKAPSRVLHFSDGVIEEFSEEEEEPVAAVAPAKVVDESDMTWGPWLLHKVKESGTVVLDKCDSMGEYLADSLGITSPKYSYEIDWHKRRLEEDARIAKQDEEAANWSEVRHLDDGNRDASGQQVNVPITHEQQINKY